MRVIHAVHRYHPATGGSERMALALAEGTARRGHEVTVVTQREPGAPEDEIHNGVRIHRLPMVLRHGIRFPQGYHRWLRENPGDMFHLHGNRIWCADFYLPCARLNRRPQIWTGHSFFQYQGRPGRIDRFYFERYIPWAASAFDGYAAHTRFEADQIVRWGLPRRRLRIIPSGFQLEEFSSRPDSVERLRKSWGVRAPRVLVFGGGFFSNKRIDRLIDAVAQTEGQWALVVLGRDVPGSPCDLRASQERARSNKVEFHATGILPRADAVASLYAADAIGLASDYEGYGLLLLEALAVGRPFVSWRIGAGPELAEETGGGFVVDSVQEFARRLVDLNDEALRRSLGARGLAAAPEYSDERLVDRYLSFYEKIWDGTIGRRGES